jgi:hypothetical protein
MVSGRPRRPLPNRAPERQFVRSEAFITQASRLPPSVSSCIRYLQISPPATHRAYLGYGEDETGPWGHSANCRRPPPKINLLHEIEIRVIAYPQLAFAAGHESSFRIHNASHSARIRNTRDGFHAQPRAKADYFDRIVVERCHEELFAVKSEVIEAALHTRSALDDSAGSVLCGSAGK